MAEEYTEKPGGYGRRPMWQWIVLYVVVGVVVYGLIYYFVLAKKGGSSYGVPPQTQTQTPTEQTTLPTTAPTGNIYMSKTDAAKGTYMTDFNGMTLYTYDKDTAGVSNCYNGCATAWPPYISAAAAQGQLPEFITVVTRTDGMSQFAWMGKPLYYYATDQKVGDITGDGVGGVWHIVKL